MKRMSTTQFKSKMKQLERKVNNDINREIRKVEREINRDLNKIKKNF